MEPIVKKIADWATKKWPQTDVANMADGGWEGWAQVEIYLHLRDNPIPGQTDILREVHCYTNKALSMDFEIRYNDTGIDKRIVIELKCETNIDQ